MGDWPEDEEIADDEAWVKVSGLNVAAPGPLPCAGTEPICLDWLLDCTGLEDEAVVGKEDSCVKLLGSILAAPSPLPSAGTDPICLDELEAAALVDSDWVDLVFENDEVTEVGSNDCEGSAATVD